jgi:predicted  nucleic acid-binding Zn-ribbon protein
MKTELERLYQDRDDVERDLDDLHNQMRDYELHVDNFEEDADYENLHHYMYEAENELAYINACIESHELGYED